MEEQAKERIEQLITKYKNLPLKLRKQYNEASTKNSFIQPLFEALGWDFSDISEVEPEQRIEMGDTC